VSKTRHNRIETDTRLIVDLFLFVGILLHIIPHIFRLNPDVASITQPFPVCVMVFYVSELCGQFFNFLVEYPEQDAVDELLVN